MCKPKILVVGSMNMDLFVKGADSIPRFGESTFCEHYGYAAGGKGANQAFAAALLGADVTMVGRLGNDEYAKTLKEELQKVGVHTQCVVTDRDCQTGLAIMLVNEEGKYVSYAVPGGNDKLGADDIKSALEEDDYDLLVMQVEMPIETVYRTYELAKERNLPVFLDAGPARNIPLERLKGLYIISPNEAETEALTGIYPDTEEKEKTAAIWLYDHVKPKYVILKLGARGAFVYDGSKGERIPGFTVNAVDSTAAGDTFGAALAIRLCKGDEMKNAIRYAHAAAGICVSRIGAQISIPTEAEVHAFLEREEYKIG